MNHRWIFALVPIALLLLAVVQTLGTDKTDPMVIPAPRHGFRWEFSGGLVAEHVADAEIIDARGVRVADARVVAVRLNMTAGLDEDLLFLTPDFRFVLASHHACSVTTASGCLPYEHISWKGAETPWLFGASRWFGAEVRLQGPDVEARFGAEEWRLMPFAWDRSGDALTFKARSPGYPMVPPHSAGSTGSFEDTYTFVLGRPGPQAISSQVGGAARQFEFREHSERDPATCGRWSLEWEPPILQAMGTIPENSDDYVPFTLAEALEASGVRLDGDDYLTYYSGGRTEPGRVESPALGLVVQEEWKWEFEVSLDHQETRRMRVTKIHTMVNDSYSYNVEPLDAENPVVGAPLLPAPAVPIDLLYDAFEGLAGVRPAAVSGQTQFESEKAISHTLVLSFALPGESEQGTQVNQFRVDAVTGNLVFALGPDTFIDAFLSECRG